MSLSLLNPNQVVKYLNNKQELFDFQMARILDGTTDATRLTTDGSFKAVCLSGVQDFDNSTLQESGYMEIIVRPITPFGDMMPDPREFTDAPLINKAMSLHGSMFSARSDYQFKDHSPIKFAQIVTCYYEKGSIGGSFFQGLRFEEPLSIELEDSFLKLASIAGVAAGSLFTPPGQWPGALNDAFDSFASVVSQLSNLIAAGGGGVDGPGNAAAMQSYIGGNNAKRPEDVGLNRAQCNELGLLYHTWIRKKIPTHIMIHCSASPRNIMSTLKGFNKPDDVLGYHFLIDRDGSFLQCAHPDLGTNHGGGDGNISKQWYGYKISNVRAIGVSMANYAGTPGRKTYKNPKVYPPDSLITAKDNPIPAAPKGSPPNRMVLSKSVKFDEGTRKMVTYGNPKWTERYPQAQYDTCVKVCAVLCLKYNISPSNILQHQAVCKKGDPGGTFIEQSKQGIEYDPTLSQFKRKVTEKMSQMKGKPFKDRKGRYVAGYMAPDDNPTEGQPPKTDPNVQAPKNGDGPVDHNGKEIKK